MAIRSFCLFTALASVALVACSNKNDAQEQREAEAQVAEQVSGEPAALPTMETDPGDSGSDPSAGNSDVAMKSEGSQTPAATALAEFDVSSVTPTTASLPPFPFFKDPEGIENNLKGPDGMRSFDRHGFLSGGRYVTQEGREALFQYNLVNPDTGRSYSEIEFLRNYENAIAALGGKKISAVQFTPDVVAAAGGRDQIEKHWAASPPMPEAEHHTYLIRTADKEYWIHVSTGGIVPPMGFVTVLEKQAMASSLTFLDAAAIKKELDAKGRVALYINFDTGKSTLRPDAQPIIAEVNKLLVADPALKLLIEGHTDNTGSADHNRELATTRARSVLGALTALGVEATRLASNGFGPDKPIADNSTDEGRAKNRRVELVKTN